ncbi:MAG: hypothetical protein PVJ75_13110 [Chloroflexota bacterium]|jgi:hypothetical protein
METRKKFGVFHFDREGLRVIVPEDDPLPTGAPIKSIAKLKPMKWDDLQNDPDQGFYKYRPVMNFAVVNVADLQALSTLDELSPSIALWVRFEPEDWTKANDANADLKLGLYYQDGSKLLLKVFSEGDEKFAFVYDHPDHVRSSGGYGLVTVSSWGDPQIVWGTSVPIT